MAASAAPPLVIHAFVPLMTYLSRFGLQRGGVRAGLRLGEREAADFFAARKGQQEFLFLFFGAEAMNRIAVKGILNRQDHAGGGATAGNFFDDDAVGDMTEARTALRFRECDTSQAQFGGFLERVARKAAGFVQLFGERLHFRFSKFADGFLEELLFFGEFEVHIFCSAPPF